MGAKKKTDVMENTDQIKIVADPTAQAVSDTPTAAGEAADESQGETAAETTDKAEAKKKPSRVRSHKYAAVRAKVDKTKKYDALAAMELLKKLSYTKFDGTVTAHLVVKEAGVSAAVTFPHSTGKSVRVAIASDDVLKEIEAGTINFDILVASPEWMGKLARFAPVLGPKGLMPNPKNGTITKDPKAAKAKLEVGTITVKTEKKAPLMHVRIGKVSMEAKQLAANMETLMKSVGTKLESASVAASMSPGIKVALIEAA
jgi:large subunit ribosomal protein L1